MSLFTGILSSGPLRAGVILTVLGVCLAGCSSHSGGPQPTLEISHVPATDPGGPEKLDFMEGKAPGALPGQQIVLYAHSGVWWIQPFANQQLTRIQPDFTWKNSTHLGTEYAALLVDSGYHPAAKMVKLPSLGNGVIAVASQKGGPAPPIVTKMLRFSGYDWAVQAAGSDRGGVPNSYDPANAFVDGKGRLHLRMTEHDGRWMCAEVAMTRNLGYGTYRFVVEDISPLEPSAVMGMFTWDEASVDDTRKELDVEISRWGKADNKNADYVVQPFYVSENVFRFQAPAGVLTHEIRWQPGVASFNTFRGAMGGASAGSGPKPVSEHVFTAGVPVPASETVHIDLYYYHHAKSVLQRPSEVVIDKFEYLP